MAKVLIHSAVGGGGGWFATVFHADGAGTVRRRRGCLEVVGIGVDEAAGPAVRRPPFVPRPEPPKVPLGKAGLPERMADVIHLTVKPEPVASSSCEIRLDDHDELFPAVEPVSTPPTPKWVGSKRIRAVQARLRKHTFSVSDKVLMRFVEAVYRCELQDYVDKRICELRRSNGEFYRTPLAVLRRSVRNELRAELNAEWLRSEELVWDEETTTRGNPSARLTHNGRTFVLLLHARSTILIGFYTEDGFTRRKAYRAANRRNLGAVKMKKPVLRFFRKN